MAIDGPDPQWTALVEPDLQLNCVAISDDGRYVLTATSLYGTSHYFATYLYDAQTGLPLWYKQIDEQTPQQNGAFWVSISGDGSTCATGGTLDGENGFIIQHDTNGDIKVPLIKTPGGVNELELSVDGADMVAVSKDQVSFVHTGAFSYVTVPGANLVSCAISRDGQWVVVGSDTQAGGAVHVYQNSAGHLSEIASWPTPTGVLKVAMDESGHWLAAGCRDGTVTLYAQTEDLKTDLWTYQGPGLGRTYALSVLYSQTEDKVAVAVGANLKEYGENQQAYGVTYVVDSTPTQSGPVATLRWTNTLEFAPNPGVHIDPNDTYVTALDGEPLLTTGRGTIHEQRGSETPGNFYLFDAKTGNLLWRRQTGLMNWGMAINRSATAIAGGSDSGVLYYWGAPDGG